MPIRGKSPDRRPPHRGDPEPGIGGASDERRLRMRGDETASAVISSRGRRSSHSRLGASVAVVPGRRARRDHLARRETIGLRGAARQCGGRGDDDRLVAGAAAEIPRKRILDARNAWDSASFSLSASSNITKPGVQKPHCEPWQSTIACWTGCRPPQRAGCSTAKLAAVERRQEADAGIDRLISAAGRQSSRPTTTVERRNRPRHSLPWCGHCACRSAASRAPSASVRSARSR